MAEKSIRLNSVWAKDAVTNIPDVPVTGTAYRDESFNDNYNEGQQYDSIYNSAKYNQFFYQVSSLLKELGEQGLLQFVEGQHYQSRAVVFYGNSVFIALREISADEVPYPVPGSSTAWLKLVWQAGKGLTTDYTSETINFNPGAGLSIDANNDVNVNVGYGMQIVDDTIMPNAGRGIGLTTEGKIEPLLGKGLEFDSETGYISVIGAYDAGQGITIDGDDISVKTGSGISVNGDGSLYLNVGNGIKIDEETNQINYDADYLLPLLKTQFLPLSGGTMTGAITLSGGYALNWNGGTNIKCVPTGNNCEYSIDLFTNTAAGVAATGTYWQVCSDNGVGTILRCNHDDGSNWMYRSLTIQNGTISKTSYNKPHLTLGPNTGRHIEMSDSEIYYKSSASTAGTGYIEGNSLTLECWTSDWKTISLYMTLNTSGVFINDGIVPALGVNCIYAWNNYGSNTFTLSFRNTIDVCWGIIQASTNLWMFRCNTGNDWGIYRILGSATCSGSRWQSGDRTYMKFTMSGGTYYAGAIIL